MGLDVGDRRVGVALSDPLGITAQGLRVLERDRGILKELEAIVREYEVGEIVVGLPVRMDGRPGPQAEKVKAFAEEIEQRLKIPVRFWDERLSTAEAERVLLQADQSRRKRKRARDKVAAAIILQGYLDWRAKG